MLDLLLLPYLRLLLQLLLTYRFNMLLLFVFLASKLRKLVRFLGFALKFLFLFGLLGLSYAIWVYVVTRKHLLKVCRYTNYLHYCLAYQCGVLLLHEIWCFLGNLHIIILSLESLFKQLNPFMVWLLARLMLPFLKCLV